MLNSIRIQNFKSYRDATIEFSPLTVLIGANASGKSNAIEALRFLSILAQGQKLSSFPQTVLNHPEGIRGHVNSLIRKGASESSFTCRFDDCEYETFEISISLRGDELHIAQERLLKKDRKVPLYQIKKAALRNLSDVHVEYDNFQKGGKKNLIACSDQIPVFSQLTSPASFSEKHRVSKEKIPAISQKIERELKSIFFLDPVPEKMRSYSPRDKILSSNGSNLSGVIYNLIKGPDFSKQEKESHKREIKQFIENLPEQNFTGIKSIQEPRGESIVALKEALGGGVCEYDASLLSDGTLRALAIAVALLSIPEHSLMVIEEIDNGIHPSRASNLLQKIRDVSQKKHLQILMTTHNPALLDAVPDEFISDTIYCFRDPETGESRLRKLSDLPNYMSLIAQDSLGGLLTKRILEKTVKLKESDKNKRYSEWLKRMNED